MRTLFFIGLTLVLAFVGFAFYRQWIYVETPAAATGDNRTRIQIAIDQEKARHEIRDALGSAALKGEILAVNAEEKHITLKVGASTRVLRVNETTTVQRGTQRIRLDELKIGEPATVAVSKENDVEIARTISVNPS